MIFLNKLKKLWYNTSAERILSLCNYSIIYNKLEENALFSTESGIEKDSELIVSLTTYSKFINQVHITIESLMEQTVKPKAIILWISNEYKDCEIPSILENLKKRGLEIRRTNDIRSYKKLIPALKEFPNNPIITCDDDLIYPYDTIESLYKAYQQDKSKIYFRRGHRMILKTKSEFIPYNDFEWEIQDLEPSIFNFPTSGAGTLYPPNTLDSEVFNENKFLTLAPSADDIWFKAMALKKGTECRKVYTQTPCYIELDLLHKDSKLRLNSSNVKQNKNDIQIKAVWDEYNLWSMYKNT